MVLEMPPAIRSLTSAVGPALSLPFPAAIIKKGRRPDEAMYVLEGQWLQYTANTRVQETRDFERGSEGQFLRAILEVRWPTWGFLAPIPS